MVVPRFHAAFAGWLDRIGPLEELSRRQAGASAGPAPTRWLHRGEQTRNILRAARVWGSHLVFADD